MMFGRLMILGAIVAFFANASPESKSSVTSQNRDGLAYHDHLGTEALPSTLDPAQFHDDRTALVAYSLAGQIKEMLYQVPCYCPCDKQRGHTSLLDCFTSRHGAKCPTCQKELMFCFRKQHEGQSPAQVRKELAKGKAWRIDLEKTTDYFCKRIHCPQK